MAKRKNKHKDIDERQFHGFHLVLNNPSDHGYDHPVIKEKLIVHFPTLQYFCMADEIGEKGTPHIHLYVYFLSRVRFGTVKRRFPAAHIQPAIGNTQENIDYIKKTGKWADTAKAETSVEGTFEEWGTVPTQKGSNRDMQELFEMIKNGYSNWEILETNNDYIMSIDKLDKVRTTYLIEKYKNDRRLDLRVIYISGATGTGKTRGILDAHGDANVYRISDYKHPFDAYNCQEVMVFDEFRSQISIGSMLDYCDIYPIDLPARYANKFMCANIVYIVSNWSLEEQYQGVQEESPDTWAAFLRRIHEVRIYHKDGTIDIYDSVDRYLNRETEFHTMTEGEQLTLPFEQEGGMQDA